MTARLWKFKQPVLFSLLLFFWAVPVEAWKKLQEGWEYKTIGSIHLFRIDPQKCRLDLLLATDFEQAALPSKNYREKSGAALVINGGFFDDAFRSLGLLVRRGETVNPIRPVEWGVFQMRPTGPSVIHRKEWSGEGVETALQVGPRLVIDGKIPSFKPETETHRRSAIGTTSDGQLVIGVSSAPVPMAEWAEAWKKETPYALNLDGGGSSQISVKLKNFSLELPGTTGIPNALAVFPKSP